MKITSAAHQTAARGGQASLGLFGIPGICPGLVAPPPYIRQPVVQKENPSLRPSRIRGVLNSFDRDGLSDACYRQPAAAPAAPVGPRMERNELGELVPVAGTTPAMRRAAAFSEARLRSEAEMRFEAAAAHRRAGAGYANRLMALEG